MIDFNVVSFYTDSGTLYYATDDVEFLQYKSWGYDTVFATRAAYEWRTGVWCLLVPGNRDLFSEEEAIHWVATGNPHPR